MEYVVAVLATAGSIGIVLFREWRHRERRERHAQFDLLRLAIAQLIVTSSSRTEITAALKELMRTATVERWPNAEQLRDAFGPLEKALAAAESVLAGKASMETHLTALCIEHEARVDLLTFAVHSLIANHALKPEVAAATRMASACSIARSMSRPEHVELYAASLRNATRTLLNDFESSR